MGLAIDQSTFNSLVEAISDAVVRKMSAGVNPVNDDAVYLASLPMAELKKKLKEEREVAR